jgi:chromosome segregation ATPase
MRASSNHKQPRVVPSRDPKFQEYIESRPFYPRATDYQPKEFLLSQLEKYRTPTKKPEPSKATEKYSPVLNRIESPDRDKQKYVEMLQNSQKELHLAKNSLNDQQVKFERLVKEQKLRINELEMENLKLVKELSNFKNSLKKDLDTLQEKDNRIIADYQKRIRESEDQNKHHIHENIKMKQNYEKEIQHLRGLLKESDNKMDIYKREFSTFHSKARKDNDELTFKEDFIKRLQDSIKEKSKTILDLKNSNEQFLRFLEDKDQRVQNLEKDLRREKEQNKLLGERLSDVIYEKSPDKNSRGRSLAPEVKFQSAKFLKPEQESHDFEGSLEKSLKKARISLIRPDSEEGLLKLKNQVIDLELKINNLTAENLQLKRENVNFDEKCKSLEDDVKSYRSLISRSSKDSLPRYRTEKEETKNDLHDKLSQALKEKEKLEKFYKDLVSEFDGNKKKLMEVEQKNKAFN